MSWIGLSTVTVTPPIASTSPLNPEKSISMKWSMRMPDIVSTVLTTQAGPASEYTELNITRFADGSVVPSFLAHSGRVTRVSRGMLTAVARVRPLGMCITRAVSERAPATLPVSSDALAPDRESEPSTRMFWPDVGSFSGRFLPRASSRSTPCRLPSSREYR